MAYVYNFCFYFSLRLGALIIAALSFVQGLMGVIIFGIYLGDPKSVANKINEYKQQYDFMFMNSYLDAIQTDPEKYLILAMTVFTFYVIFCVVMAYGAYKVKRGMLVPFLGFELMRLALLLGLVTSALLFLKQNVVSLGLLIGASVAGGFLLLGLCYMWWCAMSLWLLLGALKRELAVRGVSTFPAKQEPSGPAASYYTYNY